MNASTTDIHTRAPADTTPVFFLKDTAPTEIYTLPLHAALPIYRSPPKGRRASQKLWRRLWKRRMWPTTSRPIATPRRDRKSTRLNSSHANISYAVFCLKKKNSNAIEHRLAELSHESCRLYVYLT